MTGVEASTTRRRDTERRVTRWRATWVARRPAMDRADIRWWIALIVSTIVTALVTVPLMI